MKIRQHYSVNQRWVFFILIFSLSFISWKIDLFWPGGDSKYYYAYSDIVTNYFLYGEFKSSLDLSKYMISSELEYLMSQDIVKFEKFRLHETHAYVLLASSLNYIFNSSYGILGFQILLTYFTYFNLQKIIQYYIPHYKVSYRPYMLLLFVPIFMVALAPSKEPITIFFATFLFLMYLKKNIKIFLMGLVVFYLYRWNMALLFIAFILNIQILSVIDTSKYKSFYLPYLYVVIGITFFIGISYTEYFESGYTSFSIKNFVSAFVFPLFKFGIYDGLQINYIIFSIWNNVYSLVWYFFLPAFFVGLFYKSSLKYIIHSLLIIFILYGCISAGNQIDRIKLEFYPIYLAICMVIYYNYKNKIHYLYFVIFLMFFNFLQFVNHWFGKIGLDIILLIQNMVI